MTPILFAIVGLYIAFILALCGCMHINQRFHHDREDER